MPGSVFLELRGLAKSFRTDRPVLSGIDARFGRGEFVALLGPSGCGKSTLLRLLAGLDEPSAGTLDFGGGTPRRSFVFQEATLLPWKDVTGNVRLPAELEGQSAGAAADRARELLTQVRLEGFEKHFPAQLSGGMKMRVSLARALMVQPELFLLDEPFAALDEPTRDELDRDLRRLFERARMNVFFVTHSIAEAAFLADRVLVLARRAPSVHADVLSPLRDLPRGEDFRFENDYVAFCRELQHRLREVS